MPHQCIHCGKLIEAGSQEILDGCSNCKSRFFFYIRDEKFALMKKSKEEIKIEEFDNTDKKKVESDVRSILKIEDEEEPVILDLESVSVISPGKFEIDLVSLLNKKPIVFKLEEGKYIIDLSRISGDVKKK